MIETLRRPSVLLLLIGAIAGCSGTPKEPGQSDYSGFGGNLTSLEAASLDGAARATKRAMETLQLKPMITDRDGFSVRFMGEVSKGPVAQSHEIIVRLSRVSDKETTIDLRLRGWRDEEMLKQILDEIRKNLKA